MKHLLDYIFEALEENDAWKETVKTWVDDGTMDERDFTDLVTSMKDRKSVVPMLKELYKDQISEELNIDLRDRRNKKTKKGKDASDVKATFGPFRKVINRIINTDSKEYELNEKELNSIVEYLLRYTLGLINNDVRIIGDEKLDSDDKEIANVISKSNVLKDNVLNTKKSNQPGFIDYVKSLGKNGKNILTEQQISNLLEYVKDKFEFKDDNELDEDSGTYSKLYKVLRDKTVYQLTMQGSNIRSAIIKCCKSDTDGLFIKYLADNGGFISFYSKERYSLISNPQGDFLSLVKDNLKNENLDAQTIDIFMECIRKISQLQASNNGVPCGPYEVLLRILFKEGCKGKKGDVCVKKNEDSNDIQEIEVKACGTNAGRPKGNGSIKNSDAWTEAFNEKMKKYFGDSYPKCLDTKGNILSEKQFGSLLDEGTGLIKYIENKEFKNAFVNAVIDATIYQSSLVNKIGETKFDAHSKETSISYEDISKSVYNSKVVKNDLFGNGTINKQALLNLVGALHLCCYYNLEGWNFLFTIDEKGKYQLLFGNNNVDSNKNEMNENAIDNILNKWGFSVPGNIARDAAGSFKYKK